VLPGYVEITQRLGEVAEGKVGIYRSALEFHYALWKWQRISDVGSLAFLRRLLAEHNLIEPNPDPAWIVNRGRAEYRRHFGDWYAEQFKRWQRETLSGNQSRLTPQRIIDSGSGNGTACYEDARPGFLAIGSGLSLVYAVDGTVRNWLREPFRGPRLATYRSGLAARAFKLAEIWSVAHFAASEPTDKFDPITELDASSAHCEVVSGTLRAVIRRTKKALAVYRTQDSDGGALLAGVALGFLIDALATRARHPNGMQFSYPDSALWANAISDALAALEQTPLQLDAGASLVASAAQCVDLATKIACHLDDPSLAPEIDGELVTVLPGLADRFKAAAFELRERRGDETLIQSLHFIGNELWRWHFFLCDLPQWNATDQSTRNASACISMVRNWLERPWGILGPKDMTLAMAEWFEPSVEPPRLLIPLTPLLRSGVDHFVAEKLSRLPRVTERLLKFIGQRCRLCDSRAMTEWVIYEDATEERRQGRALADLLVELVTLWFYAQPEEVRRKIVEQGLRPLAETLQGGDWLETISLPQLSRPQLKVLDRYRNDAPGVIDMLFEFESTKDLVDRLDVYPSEEFWIIPE
jgi:hypothetical protein